MKSFLGTSANAVKTQIWTALIAMLILKYLQMKSSSGWSLSNLAAPHRGTIFLLSTDLTLAPLEILMLYAYRFKIELGFRQGVHVLGAYAYHFWMCGMKPLKRGDGDQYLHRTSHAYRAAIHRKMVAFHIHVQLGCIAQGLLQHLSLNYTAEVWLCFRSWLRTMNPALPPSELVVANALRSAIPRFFSSSQLDPKLKKILDQYSRPDIHSHLEESAA